MKLIKHVSISVNVARCGPNGKSALVERRFNTASSGYSLFHRFSTTYCTFIFQSTCRFVLQDANLARCSLLNAVTAVSLPCFV